MQAKKSSYLWSVITNKCPRCREGEIFQSKQVYSRKKSLKMHDNCIVCHQATEIEVGFYYGTGYVSYALMIAFSVATLIAWAVIGTLTLEDNSVIYWFFTNVGLMIVLQPFFMRLSRSIWLSWFVKFDPQWRDHQPEKLERIVPVIKE